MAENTTSVSSSERRVGCVKWFGSELGYGFVTQISPGENQGEDIFVHQSNISTNEEVYRILYDGETVMFDLQITEGDKHPYQAVNVTGYQDVSLQCENPALRSRGRSRGGSRGRGGRNGYSGRGRGNNGGGRRYNNRGNSTRGTNESGEPVEES